ncbi:hypothetical protein DFA_01775 [Cavenderia fasciculata]|uniref:Endonuclease/exonuclease/phosphatase domain-containing protein n=1 Tax=Cavenderia fasciculata TaxID=261658 RepID=F4PUM5_CACFS|nr:uncharacterized protein DFA_01775 [Cavenderia fasciculata]EGG21889.1 hypothetical protein DFA_01775 [Cavenderia fasciculata]|eukprot:XP_004359740.1 hypothetical protein DFA_01775 [Cavenderia fasciculata]
MYNNSNNNEDQTLRIMSFNIRYDSHKDGINNWVNRRNLVVDTIKQTKPTIIGFQECLKNQIEEIINDLGGDYSFVGVGRDDGLSKGEYSPIAYNNKLVRYDHGSHFWISQDCYVAGSKSWDTMCPRIATWGKFKYHNNSKKSFYTLNTHLDHMSSLARSEGTLLIKSFVSHLDPSIPCIITGDFNEEVGSKPYRNIIDKMDDMVGHKYMNMLKIPIAPTYSLKTFKDCSKAANNRDGPFHTFTGFTDEYKVTIDYIFVNASVKSVDKFQVLTGHLKIETDGLKPSDHLPIYADLII